MATIQELRELRRIHPKIKDKSASNKEAKRYLDLLYENDSITDEQYDKYLHQVKSSDFADSLIKAITIAGLALLIGGLLSKILDD